MRVSRLPGVLCAAGLSLIVWSCDSPVVPDTEGESAAPLFRVDCSERPDHPQCGGGDPGGGGGGETSYTLELSGAMMASETPVRIGRDNKQALHVDGRMEVSFNFNLSGASCTLNLPDGYAGDAAALEAYFRNILTGVTGSPSTRDVSPLAVDKPDATGSIRLLPLDELAGDHWVRLGDHPDVAGDFDGPGDRVLTYTGGIVRVVARMSPDSWEPCSLTVPCKASEPTSGYACSGWSESVVATLRESP